MYNIIKNIINSKDYELTDLLHKIDYHFTNGKITEEQMVELKRLAQENANPQNSIDLFQKIEALEKRIEALESKPIEEFAEWELGRAYHIGDKVSYGGKHYKCIHENCVWNPHDYPQGWEEVI